MMTLVEEKKSPADPQPLVERLGEDEMDVEVQAPPDLESIQGNSEAATTNTTTVTSFSEDRDDRLPRAFLCPISNQVFSDPVVADDGITYERSFVSQDLQAGNNSSGDDGSNHENKVVLLYPNRALRSILEERVQQQQQQQERSSEGRFPLAVGLKRWQHSASPPPPPLSNGFYCPITFHLFHEPVIDPEGYTYEKVAVENWIRVHGSSPVTRSSLSVDQLVPNLVLKRLLEEEGKKPEDQLHPEIRKWKEETPPKATDMEVGGALVVSSPNAVERGSPPTNTTATSLEHRQRQIRVGMLIVAGCVIGVRLLLCRFVASC